MMGASLLLKSIKAYLNKKRINAMAIHIITINSVVFVSGPVLLLCGPGTANNNKKLMNV